MLAPKRELVMPNLTDRLFRLCTIAQEVGQLHGDVQEGLRQTLPKAIKIGGLLLEAKGLAGHGRWLAWIEKHCRFSVDTVQLYIKLFKRRDELPNTEPVRYLTLQDAAKAVAKTRRTASVKTPPPASRETSHRARSTAAANPSSTTDSTITGGIEAIEKSHPNIDAQHTFIPRAQRSISFDGLRVVPGLAERLEPLLARWTDAAARALQALEDIAELQSEYRTWQESLPDNLRDGDVAEKLNALLEIDIESAISIATEVEEADLPLGFGRD